MHVPRWNPLRWSRRTAVIAATASAMAIALGVSLVLVFTGGSPPGSSPATPGRPRRPQSFSPFTGEPMTAPGPVLAVKIDNIAAARPPTGLTSADIVYILPVEGGLSRILAVFSSHFPAVIGPVRSAREDDLELLAQFGRPAFAYSGATPHLLPFVQRSRIADLLAGPAGTSAIRAGSRRTICTPAPGSSWRKRPVPARPATSGSSSAPRPQAAGPPSHSLSPTPRRRSRSAGRPATGPGWCPWTVSQPARPKAASSARRPW